MVIENQATYHLMSVASIIVDAIDQVMYVGSIQFPNEKVNFYAYDENA